MTSRERRERWFRAGRTPGPLAATLAFFAAACVPGPFFGGGPGACSGFEGPYVLVAKTVGGCGDIPATTPLTVSPTPTDAGTAAGYALDATWLEGCVLLPDATDSCEFHARCEAIISGERRAAVLHMTRNASGFYGPVNLERAGCSVRIKTAAPPSR